MSNPDKREYIPDERTEEEELEEQIQQLKVDNEWHEMCIRHNLEKVVDLLRCLDRVRKENAAFLKDYCPDAIGSDPEDL